MFRHQNCSLDDIDGMKDDSNKLIKSIDDMNDLEIRQNNDFTEEDTSFIFKLVKIRKNMSFDKSHKQTSSILDLKK
jgi:hypothetical protein